MWMYRAAGATCDLRGRSLVVIAQRFLWIWLMDNEDSGSGSRFNCFMVCINCERASRSTESNGCGLTWSNRSANVQPSLSICSRHSSARSRACRPTSSTFKPAGSSSDHCETICFHSAFDCRLRLFGGDVGFFKGKTRSKTCEPGMRFSPRASRGFHVPPW